MKKPLLYLALLATGVILVSQPASALGSFTNGIETIIPLGRAGGGGQEPAVIIGFCLLFGFITSLAVYINSSAKGSGNRGKFWGVLFTDFSFQAFIIPGLGTLLLLIAYFLFWSWTYCVIFSAVLGNVGLGYFCVLLLFGLLFYIASRVLIESVVSVAKAAESVNSIRGYLIKEGSQGVEPASLTVSEAVSNPRVTMLIDGKSVRQDKDNQ